MSNGLGKRRSSTKSRVKAWIKYHYLKPALKNPKTPALLTVCINLLGRWFEFDHNEYSIGYTGYERHKLLAKLHHCIDRCSDTQLSKLDILRYGNTPEDFKI